ncbi:MAG TPA: HipA domain-containing protein [Candidatus Acidoferrum sp.]|nr:HipA domain-containing protein [Candidatus Acidoferrum sp.]
MTIAVYADWEGLPQPTQLGWLHAQRTARTETLQFEFVPTALADPLLNKVPLDPRLGWFSGLQHPPQGHSVFGLFADASPDRWGRVLMQRRLERQQRAGTEPRNTRLYESDYLLGVHDLYRVGALRFRRDDAGNFLDDRHDMAAPPFVQLRKLEAASRALENDEDNRAKQGDEWLRMLIAPGGSLGGARPKASVVDKAGKLWIAKFPSVKDEHDVGAWESIVQTMAAKCGLRTAPVLAKRFVGKQHTFLIRRFDRSEQGKRLHFASAMTLTGRKDGDDAGSGASYLELAQVLIRHGAQTASDLPELWLRIVFNMLVSNDDDHLRNHGFILVPGKGWRLSEVYDLNPVPDAAGLRLNVSEADNALDLELARSVAPLFRVKTKRANELIQHCRAMVAQWRTLATSLGVTKREQEWMAPAFRLAE